MVTAGSIVRIDAGHGSLHMRDVSFANSGRSHAACEFEERSDHPAGPSLEP